jgi:hypothetical protein
MADESSEWNQSRQEELDVVLNDPLAEPNPPSTIPKYVVDGLDRQNADTLRHIAEYSIQLAIHLEAQAEYEMEKRIQSESEGERVSDSPDEWDEDEWEEKLKEKQEALDGEIPAKANRVTKTIDGRDYVYAQWREGDKVVSEYIAPVIPADSDS